MQVDTDAPCFLVLCRAIRLSEDHKPQPNVCPSEITRINDAGGCVLWGRVQVRG
jgi:hypothetical protein